MVSRAHMAVGAMAMLALVACGSSSVKVPVWQLTDRDGAHRTVELPDNIERFVEPGQYVLRARVEISDAWRGRELTLTVPAFDGLIAARIDGASASPTALEMPRRYRQPGPHQFDVHTDASADGVLELDLIVDHRYSGSAWFGASPRLTIAGTADTLTWMVWGFNLLGAIGALMALFQIGVTSATVFFTDRRRRPYLLFGAQALAATAYPLQTLGLTQLAFGRFDIPVLAFLLCFAIYASVHFTHAFFELPRPSRLFDIGFGLVSVVLVVTSTRFDSLRIQGPPTVLYLSAVTVYQVVRCTMLYREGRDRRSARYLLMSWLGLATCAVSDFIAWTGLADLLHGARIATVGLALFAFLLSLLFSQRHISSMADSDRKEEELARRVTDLERHRAEIDQLNVELRRQLTEKSQQIYAALSLPSQRATTNPTIEVGDLIDQRYRIERLLGSGGMGDVFEVTRTSDGKRFALKLTHEVSGVALARLAREAVVALSVAHDNVVRVVDVDIATAGFLFIVMELVEGAALRERAVESHDLGWTTDVLLQIARGLVALHAAGIVHRDLKPANVLLTEATDEGLRVKISDFGISLGSDMRTADPESAEPSEAAAEPAGPSERHEPLADEMPAELPPGAATVTMPTPKRPRGKARPRPPKGQSLTRTGLLPGTPAYIAPELVRGREHITPAADIFAFGVIAFELLTGGRAFKEPPALALLGGRKIVWPSSVVTTHAAIPRALAALVDRCLAEQPTARPTAVEIVDVFERASGELRAATKRPSARSTIV